MEIDPGDLDGFETFLTLSRLVSPRPIGWISTTDGAGGDNVAPYSFVSPLAVDPPVLAFQAAPHVDGSTKDTAANAVETGEFVYNVVTRDVVPEMSDTAAHVEESEFDLVGLEREPAETVDPPRVAASPAALECTVRELLEIEGTTIVFGDVEYLAVDDALLDEDGAVDGERIAESVVGHVADDRYTAMDCFFHEQPE